MADVLERLGYQIDFPEAQTCCGQPAFNSGFWEEARGVARHFLDTFEGDGPIVVPSGSCSAMCSHHYADLFQDDPAQMARVKAISSRVYEFSRFLTEVVQVDDLGASFPHTVTYHDSCHALRELKIKAGPRQLLSKVRGLTLKEMDAAEECCGFGGTFSVKFPNVSGGMAQTKLDSILRTGASHIVSIDSSCLMQLQGVISRQELPLKTIHLAEVLASR